MISEKYKELIDKLVLATQNKKIVWDKTSNDNEYKSVIGSSMVTTDNWSFPDGINKVDFAIWNGNGVQVDYISATEGSLDYTDIMKLYSRAKAAYLKVDETIADILEHLES